MGATSSHGFTMGYVSGPFRTEEQNPDRGHRPQLQDFVAGLCEAGSFRTGVTDPSYKTGGDPPQRESCLRFRFRTKERQHVD